MDKKILYFLILFFLLKFSTQVCPDINCLNCESDGKTCEECKDGFKVAALDPYHCYNCSLDYFIIDYDIDFNGVLPYCNSTQEIGISTPVYIINGTGEILKKCPPNYYAFNNTCYKYCPTNYVIDPNYPGNCSCLNRYYFDEDTKSIICLGENKPCDIDTKYIYYNDTSKECHNKTCKDLGLKQRNISIAETNKYNFQCVSECSQNEIYDPTDNICELNIRDCGDGSYYYFPSEKNCTNCSYGNCTNCTYGLFKYEDKHTCYDICPTKLNRISDKDQISECINTTDCPGDYKYFYELTNSCLKDCNDTNTTILGNQTTYIYEFSDESRCVLNCSRMVNAPFTDGERCVPECPFVSYEGFCYDNCSVTPGLYLVNDTKECKPICPYLYYLDDFFKDNLTCYKTCENNPNGRIFHDQKNRKCTDCLNGYHEINDTENICYNSCPKQAPYHDIHNHTCFYSEFACNSSDITGAHNHSFNYFYEEEPYLCLEKCTDKIDWNPGMSYVTEDHACLKNTICPITYPYEYKFICYKDHCPNIETNMYYFEDFSTGLKKCYTLQNCSMTFGDSNQFKYIQGDKCVKECDKYVYPFLIEPEKENESGYCLKEFSDCIEKGKKYFNSEKKCLKECDASLGLFSIEENKTTHQPCYRIEGTCVEDCPFDFPFKFENGSSKICYQNSCPQDKPFIDFDSIKIPYECLENCGDRYEYYGQQNIKYCVSNCRTTNHKYTFENETLKICYSEPIDCNKTNYFVDGYSCVKECSEYLYYNPETRECLPTCINEINYPYTPNRGIEIKALACLRECPANEYYDPKDKICQKQCNLYIGSANNQTCVSSCSVGEKLDKDNKKCMKECPKYFYLRKMDNNEVAVICRDNDCDFSDINDKGIMMNFRYNLNSNDQCVTTCEEQEQYLYENTCYESCPTNNSYFMKDTGETYYKCYTNCSATDHNKYWIKDGKECLAKCPDNINHLKNDTKICLEKCPDESPFYESGTDGNIICYEKCPDKKVSVDYECVDYCNMHGNDYKPYLDEANKECLEKCPGDNKYIRNETRDERGETHIFYTCVKNCENGYYITPYNQCVSKITECPHSSNFVGSNYECSERCPFNESHYKLEDVENDFKFYKCRENCSLFNPADGSKRYFHLEGNNTECLEECPKGFYSSTDICYKLCYKDPDKPFSYFQTGKDENDVEIITKMECVKNCSETDKKYYLKEDKLCRKDCGEYPVYDIYGEGNMCVKNCNFEGSELTFQYKGNCTKVCPPGSIYYSSSSHICLEKCAFPNNYKLDNNTCSSSCIAGQLYYVEEDHSSSSYRCYPSCPSGKLYYEGEYKCLEQCREGDFTVNNGSNICIQNCTALNKFYYIPQDSTKNSTCVDHCKNTDLQFTLENDTCSLNCDPLSNHFYKEEDKICLNKCPEGYNITEGNKCVLSCQQESKRKFLIENNQCAESCNESLYGNFYYIENENICLKKCPDDRKRYFFNNTKNKKEMDYQCKDECPDGYFTDGYSCVEFCPNEKKYFVNQSFRDDKGKEFKKRECLIRCPYDFQYLNITEDGFYECINNTRKECRYFIKDPDPLKQRESYICKDICDGEKKFVKIETGECVSECDSEHPYYINDTKNVTCYKKCEDTFPYYPYHFIDSYLCYQTCEYIDIDKDIRNFTCSLGCNISQFLDEEDGGQKYCTSNCGTKQKRPDMKCGDCKEDEFLERDGDKCRCKELYYYNNKTGYLTCFSNAIKKCADTGTEYKYQYKDEKQCRNICPEGFDLEHYCLKSKCGNNSKLIVLPDGTNKCLCLFKFIDNKSNNFTCLNENEDCPSGYNYYVPDTGECLQNGCPSEYKKKFITRNGTFCYKKCPEKTKEESEECKAINNWYQISKYEYIFLPDNGLCIEDYPFSIEETNECVKNCTEAGKPKRYWNKCLDNCTRDNLEDKIGTEECSCKNLWYRNKDLKIGYTCTDGTKERCDEFLDHNYYYTINNTKECVTECPKNYYSFNNICYEKCVVIGENYTTISENKCGCPGLWKKVKVTGDNSFYEIECLQGSYCQKDFLLIFDTKECYSGTFCPEEKHLRFNDICYTNCPDYSKSNKEISNECVCKNLWYNTTNSERDNKYEIVCVNDKINDWRGLDIAGFGDNNYKKNDTNEIVKNCGDDEYSFNYVCYKNSCPKTEHSINETETSKICKCDTYFGHWYKYNEKINGKIYNNIYGCGLGDDFVLNKTEPEKNLTYFINETLELVAECTSPNQKYFGQGCYKDCKEIPGTDDEEKLNICKYRALEKAKTLVELNEIVNRDIEIINKNVSSEGYTFSKFNATLEIFRVNINNTGIEKFLQNNLTSVSFEKCIENLYTTNRLDNKTELIIAKYDLTNTSNNYLINSMEYEVYSTSGFSKIDLTVCETKSIVVSYPFMYYLNNSNSLYNESYVKTLKELFDKAKKVNSQNKDIDLFNYNSSVYQNFCMPFEIDGKDVVIRDRRASLYPNITLCENNCTPYYTDYNSERIYCTCSLKKELDFSREHPVTNFNFSKNETDYMQRSPTNFPVLRCISSMKDDSKNTLFKNSAFYVTTVALAGEVVLVFVAIFYGYNKIVSDINKKLQIKDEDEDTESVGKEKGNNIKKSEENVVSSQRELDSSNPPKKAALVNTEEESDNENKGTQNNIAQASVKKSDNKKKLQPIRPIQSQRNYNINQNKNTSQKKDIKKKRPIRNIDYSGKVDVNEYPNYEMKPEDKNENCLDAIKNEEKFLRTSYEYSSLKDKYGWGIAIIAGIMDKVYLTRTIFFNRKYDNFPMLLSLYVLYHVLLLTLLASFYDIKTISKIYYSTNFPNISTHLLFGFISLIILWLIYRLLFCLINNDAYVVSLTKTKNKDRDDGITNDDNTRDKMKDVKRSMKLKMIVFFFIEFILLVFSFLYLILFCAIYTGTKKRVFTSHYISIIEILVIKILYGLLLGILRKVSIEKKIRWLYTLVSILNIYFS